MIRSAIWILPFVLSGSVLAFGQEDPFAAAIRPTGPLTPEEERAAFHLPPGFRIELFASEPQIQKPMNMAFDARGRLWVSGSTDYPFPQFGPGKAKDSIRILEDTDKDGRADKVTVFADGLTIPIGLYPYKNGAIAFGIPNIERFDDTDGDGKADRREILYGPLGYDRDTHGLNNSFRRGFDGWIYANHGFSNVTTIKGRDGSRIDLESGNTYRIRLDGSRVEQFTWGQVNPFGMTFDPIGDLYNADCHTKPIMLLLRGGHYDSFGKPHDGLGYVPPVMEHLHESTAIAGTSCYTGENFPPAFRGNMFVGNVMTSRVNRDSIRYDGSSPKAVAESDFIVSDDPWFRPVDMQTGPDGALYIADFYNKIIGHVEVPLTHPGRDKLRARIWRVTYVGDPKNPTPLTPSPDLRAADAEGLIAAFGHPNLGVRMRAGDELVDRIGSPAIEPLRKALQGEQPRTRLHSLWALHRLSAVRATDLTTAAEDKDRDVRIHAMKTLSETFPFGPELRSVLLAGLHDADPFVRRAAADAIGRHPEEANLEPLITLFKQTPEKDVQLRHVIRIALRETCKVPGVLSKWGSGDHSKNDFALMAGVALAVPNEDAGGFLVKFLGKFPADAGDLGRYLAHAAKHLPKETDVSMLATLAQNGVAGDIDLQLDLLMAIRNGLQQRGAAEPESLKSWGKTLAHRLLGSIGEGQGDWTSPGGGRPWQLEPRYSADEPKDRPFLSSMPLGEQYTGTVRSKEFVIPKMLSLSICGHLGPFTDPAIPKNLVRIRLAGSGKVLAEALAPRNDVAQRIHWDLSADAGKRGYLEVVDGVDPAVNAYAWVAVSRIDPPVVSVPSVSPEVAARRQVAAAQLAQTLGLRDLAPALAKVVLAPYADPEARASSTRALIAFHPDPILGPMASLVADPTVPPAVRDAICEAAAEPGKQPVAELVARTMRLLPQRLQLGLADRLAETRAGGERLLAMAEDGALSPGLFRLGAVREKLISTKIPDVAAQIDKLTASLPALEQETQRLIDARRADYDAAKGSASAARGEGVFTKNCAVCHQISGKGAVIGPQLDGIGNRGLERVAEDILDPSRNVDPGLVATLYALKDGRTISGLFRRQEGKNLVVVDTTGKETSFASDDIEEQRKTRLSPMPANFGAAIPEPEFRDLLAYLLAQRGEPSVKAPAANP